MSMKYMKTERLRKYHNWGIGNCIPKRKFIILYSILCITISCNNEYWGIPIYYDENISNEAASMFMEALDNDDFSRETFFNGVKPYDVYFDNIEITQSTTYGLCYIIPYGIKEKKNVIGAVYYPVDYKGVNMNNTIEFNNILKKPRFVDSDVMANEINMNEGFIYSDFFYSLKNKGLEPEEGLLKYMYLFRNPHKLDSKISNMKKPLTTRVYPINGLRIRMYLNALFYSKPNSQGIIYGISQETIRKNIDDLAARKSVEYNCNIKVEYLDAAKYSNIEIHLVADNGYIGSENFIKEFLYQFTIQIVNLGVLTSIQYEYVIDDDGDSGNNGEGSYTAGEGNAGGSGKDKNNSIKATDLECESMNAMNAKLLTGSLLTYIQDAKKGNYSKTELIDWSEFSAIINENPSNEHSINIENLPNGVSLAHVAHGKPNSVERTPYSTTIACMHNHPNETPPSPRDLLNFVSTCMDTYYEHYKSEIIYCKESNLMYAISINNKENLQGLHDRLKSDIDLDSNNFKKDSECAKLINQSYNKKMYGKTDYLINHLQLVANKYAKDKISFLKVEIELEEGKIKAKKYTTYGNRLNETKKTKYEPIKCE